MIDNIIKSIRLVHLEGINSVEVDVVDLVSLVRHIEEQKAELEIMSKKLISKELQICNLVAKSFDKPTKLNLYV